MTSRERWLAVLKREKPDRLPMDYWATGEATKKLLDYLDCDFATMLQRLHIDLPVSADGVYVGPPIEEGSDMYGQRWQTVEYDSGIYWEPTGDPPLAKYNSAEEIDENYNWPSVDLFDFSHLPEVVRENEHRPVRGGGSEPFLRYKLLRGEEQAFVDLIENPEIVEYCLEKLFAFSYESTLRIFETIPGQVMITYVAEDLGGQSRLLYSPQHIHRFLLPGMRRMVELTKQHGSYVFHHTDGAAREILPDLIDIGIEILNPIQWRCAGMDREGLKRDFGDRLIFHGAMDNQQTLPFGSVEDVRQEVRDNIRILGDGGGYILAPCHNIQAVGPPENVVAMYEEGYSSGWQ